MIMAILSSLKSLWTNRSRHEPMSASTISVATQHWNRAPNTFVPVKVPTQASKNPEPCSLFSVAIESLSSVPLDLNDILGNCKEDEDSFQYSNKDVTATSKVAYMTSQVLAARPPIWPAILLDNDTDIHSYASLGDIGKANVCHSQCGFPDRHDWAPIRAIPDERFKRLALMHIDTNNPLDTNDCIILARFEGGFHHIVMLRLDSKDAMDDYIIKIPAVGTRVRWQEGDALNMNAEAGLMKHLEHHTSIPVPQIVAFDASLHNALEAPYILMKRLPGTPSQQIRYEKPHDRNHVTANQVSEELETKCRNMLRSPC
jgi:hypothetical protein